MTLCHQFVLHLPDCLLDDSVCLVKYKLLHLGRNGISGLGLWRLLVLDWLRPVLLLLALLPLQCVDVVAQVSLLLDHIAPATDAAGRDEHKAEWQHPLDCEANDVEDVVEQNELLVIEVELVELIGLAAGLRRLQLRQKFRHKRVQHLEATAPTFLANRTLARLCLGALRRWLPIADPHLLLHLEAGEQAARVGCQHDSRIVERVNLDKHVEWLGRLYFRREDFTCLEGAHIASESGLISAGKRA